MQAALAFDRFQKLSIRSGRAAEGFTVVRIERSARAGDVPDLFRDAVHVHREADPAVTYKC